jgi:hypothetical protein
VVDPDVARSGQLNFYGNFHLTHLERILSRTALELHGLCLSFGKHSSESRLIVLLLHGMASIIAPRLKIAPPLTFICTKVLAVVPKSCSAKSLNAVTQMWPV